MATSVYLASSEGQSGKSAVAVGILHQLSRRVGRVAVFRPVVRTADADDDHVLDLLLSRLERSGDSAAPVTPHEAAGVFYDDVHHDPDAAMSTIVDRYHAVADRFDAVLVVGSDYTDIASPTEFSFNARVAANLNSPMVLVVAGKDKTPEQVRVAADLAVGDARHHHASVLAVVANRVAREDLPATITALAGVAGGVPAYAIPTDPVLDSPTVRELMAAARGTLIHGDDGLLDRESSGLIVAAMTMPNVLDRLFEGCVVISPADRADVLLALLLAHPAQDLPVAVGHRPQRGPRPAVLRRAPGLRPRRPRAGHHDERRHHADGRRPVRGCPAADPLVDAEGRDRPAAVRRARRRPGPARPSRREPEPAS